MRHSQAEHEDGGEGYFASISDLMVGILFIFLLMLTVFAINYANEDKDKIIAELEKKVEVLTIERGQLLAASRAKDDEIARLKNEITQLTADRDRLRSGLAELLKSLDGVYVGLQDAQGQSARIRNELLLTLKSDLKRSDVDIEVDLAPGILRLSSEGLFELDRDEFTVAGKKKAIALLERMAALLPCYAITALDTVDCAARQPIFETILIEGHTDTRPTDRPGGNWTLSTDRARAFLELMKGPAASLRGLRNAADQPLLGLAGYGDSRSLPGMSGEDARNRRIEVRFILSGRHESLSGNIDRLNGVLTGLRNLIAPRP
jgi:flagellar motor protein MotB